MLRPVALLGVFTSVLVHGPLGAQSHPPSNTASGEDRERAKRLAEEGRRAYEAGELERAEGLIRGAYTLDASPILVYNLGRILDAKGDTQGARTTYLRYLELDPATRARARIERRIKVLDELISKEETRPPPPEPPPISTVQGPPRASDGTHVLPWIMVGTGAAAIGAGAVVGFLARDKANQARDERVQLTAEERLSEGETLATVANVLYVAGGVLAAGGVVWALLAGRSEPPAMGVVITPEMLSLMGHF